MELVDRMETVCVFCLNRVVVLATGFQGRHGLSVEQGGSVVAVMNESASRPISNDNSHTHTHTHTQLNGKK